MLYVLFAIVAACTPDAPTDSSEPPQDTSTRWELLTEDDLNPGKDDSGDTGKDDTCGPEVVAGEACQGGWEATLCVDDQGEYWWCQDGVWTSDK
jgi:hypothetical protein